MCSSEGAPRRTKREAPWVFSKVRPPSSPALGSRRSRTDPPVPSATASPPAYAKEGANLVITGRNAKKLETAKEKLEAEYGIQVLCVAADVNAGADNQAVVQNVIDQAIEKFGRIDVLVNNAQASASGVTLADHTTDQFDLAIYSGLYATFYYMQACYPYLKETKGSVINFASGAGLFGNFGQCCLRRRQGGHPRH